MNTKPKIRHAKITDLPAIVDIYNQAIRSKKATGDITEFTVEERIEWFNKYDIDNYPIYVSYLEGVVVGYASLSPYRPGRMAFNKVAEITFYLNYKYRGLGLGSKLVEHIISDCKRVKKETLLAILLDVNTDSIQLLKKFNFKEWGSLPLKTNFGGQEYGHLIYGINLKH